MVTTNAGPATTPPPARATGRFGLSPQAQGTVALVVTVLIWAAFALSARALSTSSLLPADAALLRFGVPLLVLAPALWRRRRRIAAVRPAAALKIACGAGVPFFLAAMYGGSLTSAAFVGSIVPGMVPLFVSALMVAGGRGAPRGTQAAGLGLIAVGVVALVWRYVVPLNTQVLAGAGILLVASGLWALYTVGLKEVDLDPVGSIGLLCLPSFAVMALLVLTGVLPTGLASAAGSDIALFLVVQGLGVGLCAGLLYAFAIRSLGAERSSTVGSLSPVAVVLLAIPLLDESPTVAVLVGVPLIAAGVALANRRPRTRTRPQPEVPVHA
ncbi:MULTISPECIES: EamA family transporter [unclassified Streptomyces]|uniref:EamA family transporter n=1 Tax=unclassified Streptomyces TaxID=2593676 RepID=UPI00224EC7A2|nr:MULTISPECIES: DMT family transporter [unclassified Streptomyces]MCX4631208.1 DMT family transporter [Streptomyces sp. NBC_01443]WSW47089.1 DMT family transporter [Streptomyces sp. NBC_01001]